MQVVRYTKIPADYFTFTVLEMTYFIKSLSSSANVKFKMYYHSSENIFEVSNTRTK
jgi:hypothetical protein